MVKGYFVGYQEIVTKEIFLKVVKMDKENGVLNQINNTKVNIFMIKNMDRVDLNGQMVVSIKDNSRMISSIFSH